MKHSSWRIALGDHEGDELILRKDERDQTFVVRCWIEPESNLNIENNWRFMVERVGKGSDPHGFTDLESLMSYINTELTRTEVADGQSEQLEEKSKN